MTFEEAMRVEVRWAMAAGDVTQTELAYRVGVSQTHVSRIMTGRSGLSPDMYERMLAVCGRRPVAASVAL